MEEEQILSERVRNLIIDIYKPNKEELKFVDSFSARDMEWLLADVMISRLQALHLG